MNNINPIYNSYNLVFPQFKAKEENKAVTNPIQHNQIGNMQGFNALANYNIGMINKSNLDIPVLTPPNIEKDINKINGERIYNSDGTLIRIVDENNKEWKIYNIINNKLDWYKNLNKETGEELNSSYNLNNGNCEFVSINYPDGNRIDTSYDKYGNVSYKQKHDKNDISYLYDNVSDKYHIDQYSDNKATEIELDKNKNLIKGNFMNYHNNTDAEIKFYNNKPYKVNIEKQKNLPNKININTLNLKGLEPASFEDFNIEEVKRLDGKKKFYSDGKLEKVITNDGTIYELNYDQNDLVIKRGNTEINKNVDKYRTMLKITEKLADGATKVTRYSDNIEGSSVQYLKGDIEKWIEYSSNGDTYYTESCHGEEVKKIAYDKDGNLLEHDIKE